MTNVLQDNVSPRITAKHVACNGKSTDFIFEILIFSFSFSWANDPELETQPSSMLKERVASQFRIMKCLNSINWQPNNLLQPHTLLQEQIVAKKKRESGNLLTQVLGMHYETKN